MMDPNLEKIKIANENDKTRANICYSYAKDKDELWKPYHGIILKFGKPDEQKQYHEHRKKAIEEIISSKQGCDCEKDYTDLLVHRTSCTNCTYMVVGSDSAVSDRDITLFATKPAFYLDTAEKSKYDFVIPDLVKIVDAIDVKFYTDFKINSNHRFDCNTYMTTHCFSSFQRNEEADDKLSVYEGAETQKYRYVYWISKKGKIIDDQLKWASVRLWYYSDHTNSEDEIKHKSMNELINLVNVWKNKPTVTSSFRCDNNWHLAMSIVLDLSIGDIERMKTENPPRYGINKMSAAMWLENDAYCAQGTFKHIVLREVYPQIPLSKEDLIESMYDNLGFMFQIQEMNPMCSYWIEKVFKLSKYVKRICMAALDNGTLKLPSSDDKKQMEDMKTMAIAVDEARKKGSHFENEEDKQILTNFVKIVLPDEERASESQDGWESICKRINNTMLSMIKKIQETKPVASGTHETFQLRSDRRICLKCHRRKRESISTSGPGRY